jgi:DNA-binding response OmpR family regulator
LIGAGYRESELWPLTPRQLIARLRLARRRRRHELAAALSLNALAARGEAKDLKRQLKKLQRD